MYLLFGWSEKVEDKEKSWSKTTWSFEISREGQSEEQQREKLEKSLKVAEEKQKKF